MKKYKWIWGILITAFFVLTACQGKSPATGSDDQSKKASHQATEQTEQPKEKAASQDNTEKDEAEAKKTAEKVLNAMLKDEKASFLSILGISYKDFVYRYVIKDFVNDQKVRFEPENEWMIAVTDWKSYTPTQILEKYMEIKVYTVIPAIREYQIKSVEVNANEATVTFESKGIDVQKGKQAIEQISDEIFSELEIDKEQLMTENEKGHKIIDLFNYYLYICAFSSDHFPVPLTQSSMDFSLKLQKKNDEFIITQEEYVRLLESLFVKDEADTNLPEGSSTL